MIHKIIEGAMITGGIAVVFLVIRGVIKALLGSSQNY